MEIKKTINFISKIFFGIMCILAGFSFIVMGLYIIPNLEQYMIDLNKQYIKLTLFLFTGGIAGGSTIISYLGLKLFILNDWEKKCQ